MSRSSTTESTTWTWLKAGGKKFRTRLHMDRVENAVLSGMPDVEGCLDGQQFWIELKCEARPAKATTTIKPKFRPAQIPWHKRRLGTGMTQVFILLQVGSGTDAARYLVHSSNAETVANGLTEVELKAISIVRYDATSKEILCAASLQP